MGLVLRIALAVLIALAVTLVLDFFGLLNHQINALIGIIAGVVYFMSSH